MEDYIKELTTLSTWEVRGDIESAQERIDWARANNVEPRDRDLNIVKAAQAELATR